MTDDATPDPDRARDAAPLARRLAPEADALAASLRRFRRMWSTTPPERMPMVSWFDPAQLLRTGLATLVSTVVGRRSDARVTMAIAAGRRDHYDCRDFAATRGGDVWLDYVCDTGDGWNSTYAIAWAVAQPQLEVAAPDGSRHPVQRADVLVFGGDQVYPSPSREEYERRLVEPYAQAFGEAPDAATPTPEMYAIPGNHDWYDGLSAFTRLFCTDVGGRRLGGWRTRQSRSYFALRLPGRWWLLGCDSQLQADLDPPQIEYFREIAERDMAPGDRAILCLAQPTWVYAHKYRQFGGRFDETDLLYLREEVFAPRGVELQVFLAGDLHHYRRHEELVAPGRTPIQKITAGGGGAFLHPTHDEDVSRIAESADAAKAPREYALRAAYPAPRTSRRLAWRNLLFAGINPTFGSVPALLYAATAWLFAAAVDYEGARTPAEALARTGRTILDSPGLALWLALVAGAFVLFTDTTSKAYKVLGGLAHATAHGACLFFVGWGAALAAQALAPHPAVLNFTAGGLLVFAGGWLLGSIVLGLYLLVSLNLFGRHSEEAFSSLRIQDYKQFLRLHVRADGGLVIYPIGIDSVPRRWRERRPDDASPSLVQPTEPLAARLIEAPIQIPPRGTP
jgi:hypothetical protein